MDTQNDGSEKVSMLDFWGVFHLARLIALFFLAEDAGLRARGVQSPVGSTSNLAKRAQKAVGWRSFERKLWY